MRTACKKRKNQGSNGERQENVKLKRKSIEGLCTRLRQVAGVLFSSMWLHPCGASKPTVLRSQWIWHCVCPQATGLPLLVKYTYLWLLNGCVWKRNEGKKLSVVVSYSQQHVFQTELPKAGCIHYLCHSVPLQASCQLFVNNICIMAIIKKSIKAGMEKSDNKWRSSIFNSLTFITSSCCLSSDTRETSARRSLKYIIFDYTLCSYKKTFLG